MIDFLLAFLRLALHAVQEAFRLMGAGLDQRRFCIIYIRWFPIVGEDLDSSGIVILILSLLLEQVVVIKAQTWIYDISP